IILNYSHLKLLLSLLFMKTIKQEMADNKPWVLISEIGDKGFHEDVVDIINQHFHIVCLKEFLQNPALHGPKIQGMFMWNFSPAAEPSLLSCLPSLKVIANGGVGIDHLDVPYINSFGVKVTNTPGVVSDATADMAMALLLASARTVIEGEIDSKTTHVPQSLMGVEVTGSTLGIIGMGHIGYKVAQRSKGFNMRILYHNRNRRSTFGPRCMSKRSGQVTVNLSPGLKTQKNSLLYQSESFNVSALMSGTIRAAALDVTHPEPLPRDHPLLTLPNVLITPHIGTNTRGTIRKMVQMMVDNVLAAVKGLAVPNEVKAK
uniref:Zgc:136493 n=1 Tax=Poecilia latipinna TaxID=48699 RepID=A0A3B3V328_9TELE